MGHNSNQPDQAQADCPELEQRLKALVTQAAQGDCSAFEDLYRSSIRMLMPAVRHICGVHAEDVLAETYFQAWKTLASFDAERGSVTAWLLTIARSRARDRMRAERSRHGGIDGALPHEPDERTHEGAGPEEQVSANQQRERLYAALARLSSNQRWVLALAYHRDHSHSEISALTGMPLGTIKTLILRSQRQLRGMMQPAAHQAPPGHYVVTTS